MLGYDIPRSTFPAHPQAVNHSEGDDEDDVAVIDEGDDDEVIAKLAAIIGGQEKRTK